LTCGVKTKELQLFKTSMIDLTKATDPDRLVDSLFNNIASGASQCGPSPESFSTQSYILDLGSFCLFDLMKEVKFYSEQRCNYEKCLFEQANGTRDATENCQAELDAAICTRWRGQLFNALAGIGGQYSYKNLVGIYSKWVNYLMDLPEKLLDKTYNLLCGVQSGGGLVEGVNGKIGEIEKIDANVNWVKLVGCNIPKAWVSGKRLIEYWFPLARQGPCIICRTGENYFTAPDSNGACPNANAAEHCTRDPYYGLFKFDETKCDFHIPAFNETASCPVKYPLPEEHTQ
jgi:hypothetical protein